MTERRLSVLVNGRFLTQPLTGVQRYGLEIVRHLEKNFALAVCVPARGGAWTDDRRLATQPCGRMRGHLWEQWDLARRIQSEPKASRGRGPDPRGWLFEAGERKWRP